MSDRIDGSKEDRAADAALRNALSGDLPPDLAARAEAHFHSARAQARRLDRAEPSRWTPSWRWLWPVAGALGGSAAVLVVVAPRVSAARLGGVNPAGTVTVTVPSLRPPRAAV